MDCWQSKRYIHTNQFSKWQSQGTKGWRRNKMLFLWWCCMVVWYLRWFRSGYKLLHYVIVTSHRLLVNFLSDCSKVILNQRKGHTVGWVKSVSSSLPGHGALYYEFIAPNWSKTATVRRCTMTWFYDFILYSHSNFQIKYTFY